MVTQASPVISTRIPLSEPLLSGEEWKYVKDCLDTGMVATGPYIKRFEDAVAEYCNAAFAVAACNGTAGLHIALLIAGVRPGDAVLVSDITFVAPVNAINYCRAHPIFMDVEAERWQMDTRQLRHYLEHETVRSGGELRDRTSNRRLGAILAVHLLGLPCDIAEIAAIAQEFGVPLVQDAAQSLGAEQQGRRVGSFPDVTVFSFNGNKIVTAGGGGMIVTDRADLAERARYYINQAKDDGLYFRHENVGFNYRLSNIHAAIGYAQMFVLDSYIEAKRAAFRRYRELLAHCGELEWVEERAGDRANYWLISFLVPDVERRDAMLRSLNAQGIECRPPWRANHTQTPYRGERAVGTSTAALIEQRGLHIPSSPALTDTQIGQVAQAVEQALRAPIS